MAQDHRVSKTIHFNCLMEMRHRQTVTIINKRHMGKARMDLSILQQILPRCSICLILCTHIPKACRSKCMVGHHHNLPIWDHIICRKVYLSTYRKTPFLQT